MAIDNVIAIIRRLLLAHRV